MPFFLKKTPPLWLKRTGKVAWEVPLTLQRVSGVVLSLFTSGLIIAMVIFRYFLHVPLMWVEEICLYVIFWFFMLGAAYATYRRLHIVGGIAPLLFQNKPRALGGLQVGTLTISFGLSCLLAFWSFGFFHWSIFGTGPPLTMQLFLPLAWAQLSLFVGFSLMALYFLWELIDSVRDLLRLSRSGQ